MLRVGIPSYRLPQEIVTQEVADILALGIDLRLNQPVTDAVALLAEGECRYDAVFVAVGAHFGARLPIPGVDLPEVTTATDFLRYVALGGHADPPHHGHAGSAPAELVVAGKRVLVLGGGNVAVDAAMTARRLGATWVGMACLESRAAMPAHDWEIADAEEEGIALFPSRTFKEIASADGHVSGLRCAEIEFRGFAEGRPDFDELADTEHTIEADLIIFAIGQRPVLACLPDELKVRGRYAAADPHTLATEVPGLFAGGDAVTGTAFVVDAIAAGHRAANSIDAFLRGEPVPGPDAWAEPKLGVEVADLSEEEARERVRTGNASAASRHEPAKVPVDRRMQGFEEIYGPLREEQARAEAARCLSCGICSECNSCVVACQKHCIDHDMVTEFVDLKVGALVLAPGVETVPGSIRPELGYGRCANVVTSIEFERQLSASGPWSGVVQRPSDGRRPHRIAFIQCVGSRDAACGQGYCSSVCCMAATKEAVIAQEHDPDVQATIFYMDIRSFGKGFERYVTRAEQELGVRYVRSLVSTVTEVPGSGDLRVRYATGDGHGVEEVFDLVVLSVGLRPDASTRELAGRVGIALNEYGFAEPPSDAPGQVLATASVAGAFGEPATGVYVAGAFAEPRDIPEAVTSASCAAAQASALLAGARGTLTETRSWPEERDVSDELPRVGVFVCHCGINIGAVVDVPDVVAYAASLPGVVYAEHNLYTCSQDTQERIRERIEEHDLNRVVVASCTPRTHEPLFQETLRGAGLNPHLFHMANIREQVSWVHRADHASATEKARELVRMAVARAERLHAIAHATFDVDHRALVIGGGLAGMTAALSVAEQGFGVTLVEREPFLAGNLRHILIGLPSPRSSPGETESMAPVPQPVYPSAPAAREGEATDPQKLLQRTIEAVAANPRMTVLTGAEVTEVSGYVGQYRTTVRRADGMQEEIQHGVIILATGARQIAPADAGREYLYGDHPGIVTQRELEQMLVTWQQSGPTRAGAEAPALPRRVVMIQCVGSRDEAHPYCSRICCTEAIKNALALKGLSSEIEVIVLYRDLRTFGFKERYYQEARRQGVVFLQFDVTQKPQVSAAHGVGSSLRVSVAVQPENEPFSWQADLVVLSAGIEPNDDNKVLARLLKVPLNEDGFFLEAHTKLRPLEFAADGVYLCGMAHSPRFLDETIAQAQGAAIQAVKLLSRRQLEATPIVATVNPRLCVACGLCVEVCPYGARVLEPGAPTAEVIEVLCQGCGACVTACPNKASQQRGFEVAQIHAMLDSLDSALSLEVPVAAGEVGS
jgi:heterodisulfide reductase subunit A-like polyferredoxin